MKTGGTWLLSGSPAAEIPVCSKVIVFNSSLIIVAPSSVLARCSELPGRIGLPEALRHNRAVHEFERVLDLLRIHVLNVGDCRPAPQWPEMDCFHQLCGRTENLPFGMQQEAVNPPPEGLVYRNAAMVLSPLKGL